MAHKAIHEDPIQKPKDPAKPKGPAVEAEQFIINLLATDSFPREDMVTRKTLTIDRFVPDVRQVGQPPPSQSQVQAPPPPPPPQSGLVRKRQKVADHPPTGSGDAVILTPPRPTGGIVIQEPQTQVGPGTTPPLRPCRRGSPSFCWTTSLYLQPLMYGCGKKVKEVALLRPWPRASFCPMMYTPLRKGRRSLWDEGYSGIPSW